jgi:hypothetical protein
MIKLGVQQCKAGPFWMTLSSAPTSAGTTAFIVSVMGGVNEK